MARGDVLELIDSLNAMISEAWPVPLGNDKCIVERRKALAILEQIKALLPRELAEASRIVAARDEYLGNARAESEALRKSAEETAREMISEQYVIRQAEERSRELLNNAETRARELYRVVNAYVDDRLEKTETAMNNAAAVIANVRKAYKAASAGLEQEPEPQAETEEVEGAPAR